MIEARKTKANLPNNSLILSFDDGYYDHYQYVFPVLKKFKLKGIFFPVGKPCLERSILDVNKIHFILDSTNKYDDIVNYLETRIQTSNLENKSIEYYRKRYLIKNKI